MNTSKSAPTTKRYVPTIEIIEEVSSEYYSSRRNDIDEKMCGGISKTEMLTFSAKSTCRDDQTYFTPTVV